MRKEQKWQKKINSDRQWSGRDHLFTRNSATVLLTFYSVILRALPESQCVDEVVRQRLAAWRAVVHLAVWRHVGGVVQPRHWRTVWRQRRVGVTTSRDVGEIGRILEQKVNFDWIIIIIYGHVLYAS